MKIRISPFNWYNELQNATVDAIGRDLILFSNPDLSVVLDQPFKMDITTAIICLSGEMKGNINLEKYHFKAPCLFIVLSEQILQNEYISDDFSGQFIIMSDNFLNSMYLEAHSKLPLFSVVRGNPVMPLDPEGLKALKRYFEMIQETVRLEDNPNRLEISKHLTLALFYRLGSQYHKVHDSVDKTKHEILSDNFIKLIRVYYKEQRAVQYYATKLNLTPKYLSKIIKETSGKSVNEWIDDYVILEAKALLKSTNMTVQQISDELNFPSQSFFGKYFKRKVGFSPKEYSKS